MASKYEWRTGGPRPPVEPDVFAAELEKLAAGDAIEMVDPDEVWKTARKRSSPIHACFNWNVQQAAEAHWRDHARHLIRGLVIVQVEITEGPAQSRRAFYSVNIEKRRGYVTQSRVQSDRDLKLQIIAATKKELETYLAKYVSVLGFGNVIPRLRSIIETMQDEIDRLEKEATARRPKGDARDDGPRPSP